MSNNLEDNFAIIGKHLDIAELASIELLEDLYPDVTNEFMEDYERVYKLINTGTQIQRHDRIVSAMRQRGGLSKAYFESIGNKLGGGIYTVSISQGTGNTGFIIAPRSVSSSPAGPATLIPGLITTVTTGDNQYYITVTITGSSSEPNLEKLYERLKPAWTIWDFIYIA